MVEIKDDPPLGYLTISWLIWRPPELKKKELKKGLKGKISNVSEAKRICNNGQKSARDFLSEIESDFATQVSR